MVKIIAHESWKPVSFPQGAGTFEGFEHLAAIGFQELSDYTIDYDGVQPEIISLEDLESDHDEPSTVVRKNKKKAKKKETVIQPPIIPSDGASCSPKKHSKDVEKIGEASGSKSDTEKDESGKGEGIAIKMAAWYDLYVPEPVLKALADLGFTSPTPIQSMTLPSAIRGCRDIVGAAETGSGKTLAFGIPIIHGILEDRKIEFIKNEFKESLKDKICGEKMETCDDDDDDDDDEDGNSDDEGAVGNITVEEEENDEECDDSEDEDEAKGISEEDVECVTDGSVPGLLREYIFRDEDLDFTSHIPTDPKHKLRALILTPTRELALQIQSHLRAAAKYTDIKIGVLVGGMSRQKQDRLLRKCPEIIVATPGRLWDFINIRDTHMVQAKYVKYLVIDETDRMLEKGHFKELKQILSFVNASDRKMTKRQNFVFSATMTLVHDPPKRKVHKKKGLQKMTRVTPGQKLQAVYKMVGIEDPKVIDLTQPTATAGQLKECRITCGYDEKDAYLYYFVRKYPGRTLVFANSINCVRRLNNLFNVLECNPQPLHAQLHQKQRLKGLEKFTANPNSLLIATDVAARGLDIPNIQHVIHYELPKTAEAYVHRSGRTARASSEGLSVILVEPKQVQLYSSLCNTLGKDWNLTEFPVDSGTFSAVKRIVSVARDLEKMEYSTRKQHAQHNWLLKAAADMDLEIDEDDAPWKSTSPFDVAKQGRAIKAKKSELQFLLQKTIFNQDISPSYPTKSGHLNLTSDQGAEQKSALQSVRDEEGIRGKSKKKRAFKQKSGKKEMMEDSQQMQTLEN